MKIAVLCPTRSRPFLAKQMAQSCIDTATNKDDIQILLYLNDDDSELGNYTPLHEHEKVKILVGNDAPTAWSWNYLATKCEADIFLLMGDDALFITEGWDVLLCEQAKNYPDNIFCFGFNNDIEFNATPHVAIGKGGLRALGYFVPPIFLHWYVDTWSVEVYKKTDRYKYLQNITVKHNTPKVTGRVDDTFLRSRQGHRAVWNMRDGELYESAAGKRYMNADVGVLWEVIHKERGYK